MLAKCTNPACSDVFRYVEEGTLFRLESDPAPNARLAEKPEYYWLCSVCSQIMTLCLAEGGKVSAVPLRGPVENFTAESSFAVLERKDGWVLSRLLPLNRFSRTHPDVLEDRIRNVG